MKSIWTTFFLFFVLISLQAQEEGDAVQQRLKVEETNVLKPFTIMPHKPNFMLLGAFNQKGYDASLFRQQLNDKSLTFEDIEAQFQLSLKVPIALNFFSGRMNIFGAYTNRSFWQVYNPEISSPFRETNHEPEFWFQFRHKNRFLGLDHPLTILGISHQSNGRSGVLSRSWNRVYAAMIMNRGNLAVQIKPWIRISEDEEEDDNPDIDRFLGHGELRLIYKWNGNTFQCMLRNALESGFQRTGFEYSWSFPFYKYDHFRGYLQGFSGYGESLIDYDRKVNRIAIGVSLSDFL